MRSSSVCRIHPLIKFLGKNRWSSHIDNTPHKHPMDPHDKPPSWISHNNFTTTTTKNPIKPDEVFSRSDLPKRYQYPTLSPQEIETVDEGGAGWLI